MRSCCVLFLTLHLALPILRAQEEQITTQPPLRQSFPFEPIVGGVHVKVPVLLNDHLILRPTYVLRFIYLDSNAASRARREEAGGDGGRTPEGGGPGRSRSGPYGGWSGQAGNEYAGVFDDYHKEDARGSKSELKSEVWTQEGLFQDALDHASEFGTTFVYSLPSQAKAQTGVMDLPEGMLLAEEGGHVHVLAMEEKSRAFAAGVRPGDQIISLGAGAPLSTLPDFLYEYGETKRQAKISGNLAYPMQIVRGDNNQPATIQVEAPPTLPSLF